MRKILLFILLLTAPALAHSVRHEVADRNAIAVRVTFSGGDVASYSAVEVFGPGDETPFQKGRTDRNGVVAFIPDRPGEWMVKVQGESQHGFHGDTVEVTVGPERRLEAFTQPPVETHTRILVGVGCILGIFGGLALWKSRRAAAVLALLILGAAPLDAHEYWLVPDSGRLRVVYGHEHAPAPYDPAQVRAHAPARLLVKNKTAWIVAPARATAVAATVDGGAWVKTVDGWRRGSRVPHAVDSVRDLYYCKVVYCKVVLAEGATRPLALPLEIVPLSRGKIRVLLEGRPLADATVIGAREQTLGTTDARGELSVVSQTRFCVSHRQPLPDNAEVAARRLTATLIVRYPP